MPWPDPGSRENPYQRLLYAALRAGGIEIVSPPWRFGACGRQRDLDWFHVHWPGWLTGARSAIARRRKERRVLAVLARLRARGTRILWTMHNRLPHDAPDLAGALAFRRELVTLCDLVHVHFPAATAVLRDEFAYDGAVVEVPHGSYGEFYGPPMARDDARQRLRISPDETIFLCAGRLRPYKNLEWLIEAFHQERRPGQRLLLYGRVGPASYAAELHRRVAPCPAIELVPRGIADADMAVHLSAADVFVLPARHLFTSGTAMLALTYGLPLVARCENQLAALRDEPFVFDWNGASVDALALAMQRAADTRERDELRRAALGWAAARRWEALVAPLVTALCGP